MPFGLELAALIIELRTPLRPRKSVASRDKTTAQTTQPIICVTAKTRPRTIVLTLVCGVLRCVIERIYFGRALKEAVRLKRKKALDLLAQH
jgi:hypothetical protein